MKKSVEYINPVCSLSTIDMDTYRLIDKTFTAIEENFHNIKFYCQKFEDNMLIGGYEYKLPKCILDKATCLLDGATDEFYIYLTQPVTTQIFDGIAKQDDNLYIEVVTEEIAQMNDNDFIGNIKIEDLIEKGEYKLGEKNSYYEILGTVDGTNFYYREL